MNEGDMLTIQVPGSTANLGPGFDSIGLALDLYLRLEVEKSDKWEVVILSEDLKDFPKDETNFIVQIALQTAAKYHKPLPSCRIKMTCDIPLARGLGSSAAAIIAGIELADAIGHLNLTKNEKFTIAANIEGHPDNVGASLFGGLVIGSQLDDDIEAVVCHELDFDIIAIVPKHELLTKDSRNVLPLHVTHSEAVKAGAIANVMIAALLRGDYELAGRMMKKDLYHQPYRRGLVPHLQEIEGLAYQLGAFAVALSGAGPTVICCCEKGKSKNLLPELKSNNPEKAYLQLNIDQIGSSVNIQKYV